MSQLPRDVPQGESASSPHSESADLALGLRADYQQSKDRVGQRGC